jgi:hypothetical protein
MCDETKCCEDCKCEAKEQAPAFDMFEAKETAQSDEIGAAILASIEKIAHGVLTLQQEIALLAERVEAHEAHLSYILAKDPDFVKFIDSQKEKMKEAVAAQSETTLEM